MKSFTMSKAVEGLNKNAAAVLAAVLKYSEPQLIPNTLEAKVTGEGADREGVITLTMSAYRDETFEKGGAYGAAAQALAALSADLGGKFDVPAPVMQETLESQPYKQTITVTVPLTNAKALANFDQRLSQMYDDGVEVNTPSRLSTPLLTYSRKLDGVNAERGTVAM